MKFKLRFSNEVLRDLDRVLIYTGEHFGPQKYREYQQLIRSALRSIESHPFRAPAKSRPDIHPDAMTFHIAKRGQHARHLFLYRVREDQRVEISRLLHDSADLQQHLPAWD
jgi:toxin ParE1/3/4